MNKKIAVFPGSFDPITKGHESIILKASLLFDEVIVAIGLNSNKKYKFSLEQRKTWINTVFSKKNNISVSTYSGLTIDYCKTIGAQYLVRGLRTAADFEFEKSIAQMNQYMHPNIETVLLLTPPELTPISSSIVREIVNNNGDVSQFIPDTISIGENS